MARAAPWARSQSQTKHRPRCGGPALVPFVQPGSADNEDRARALPQSESVVRVAPASWSRSGDSLETRVVVDVPVQYFQSVIAIELAIAGALL
jgi:hypothetical protein